MVLMEADLLDETGALSIVWDCMLEGSQEIQTFDKTYSHILKYTGKDLTVNPMVTKKAKEFWEAKQSLVQGFLNHLSYDLGISELF